MIIVFGVLWLPQGNALAGEDEVQPTTAVETEAQADSAAEESVQPDQPETEEAALVVEESAPQEDVVTEDGGVEQVQSQAEEAAPVVEEPAPQGDAVAEEAAPVVEVEEVVSEQETAIAEVEKDDLAFSRK